MSDDVAANLRLHEMMSQQAAFLHSYFSETPLGEAESSTAAAALPLLDYLYDKQLQLHTDVRDVLGEEDAHAEARRSLSTEEFVGHLERVLTDNHHAGFLADVQVKNLRTLYRFRLDNQLQDHTGHYQQSFLPFYRFSRHRNFSQAVGSTMKRNIRALYDYVRTVVPDPAVCPCIILFNLFIRDNFRLFSLLSMQHYNYVRVVDDWSGEETIVSYVELTNIFPQISQWFPNINGQYVKKHGPHSFQKLYAHVMLLVQQQHGRETPSGSGALSGVAGGTATAEDETETRRAGTGATAARVLASRSRSCRVERGSLAAKQQRSIKQPTIQHPPAAAAAVTHHRRLHLEQLFSPRHRTGDEQQHTASVLDQLFRSNYRECKHANVVRLYVQLRSADESATLIMRCLLCGKRL